MTGRRAAADQIELFAVEPRQPAGFAYRDAIVTAEEEAALAEQFASLPFKPFEFHGHLGNRRIVSFGQRYDYSARSLQTAPPMPDFLAPLRNRAAEFAGIPPESIAHVLVTEYAPGAGIGWHRDRPNFEDVIGGSLLTPCALRFRRKDGAGWERVTRQVAPRSAYLLRGPARHEWEHSISPIEQLRYSVTFRSLVDKTGTRSRAPR